MRDGAPIDLIAFVLGLAAAVPIGAVFLRAAVALYNKIAAGATSSSMVPEPAFGKAMVISFVRLLPGLVIWFVVRLVSAPAVLMILSPVNLLIMAAILSAMLPTTFGRAILVTLCEIVIYVLFVVGLLLIGYVLITVALR
jgi:hypothetical protein